MELTYASDENKSNGFFDAIATILIMALLGAFFWAIRGTGGYGGETGGALAGLGWAMLWFLFSKRGGLQAQRPYGGGAPIAAIVFGIALGGFTGYGVYTGWVRGVFYLDYPNGLRDVAPWTGYAMLFLCGLHWGGNAGAFLAWCAPRTPLRWTGWTARIASGVAGAVLALLFVRAFPQLFLPFYDEGLYADAANKTCTRALLSIQNIAPHVGLFLGFLLFEITRRDWRAVGVMLMLGLGFALPFTVGGIWHTFNDSTLKLEWWKNWEMSIGLGGGAAFGLAFLLFNRPNPSAPSRMTTCPERTWGAVAPTLYGATVVVQGCLDGVVSTQHLAVSEKVLAIAVLCFFMLTTIVLGSWAVRQRRAGLACGAGGCAGELLPGWTPPAALALIILAGWAVSIPNGPLTLAHGVLLALYSVYLLGALFLAVLLLARR